MDNLQISGTIALAIVGWVLGFGLIVTGILMDNEVGNIGLYLTGGAMALTSKRGFCRMRQRERDAFEMGQDSVRSIH